MAISPYTDQRHSQLGQYLTKQRKNWENLRSTKELEWEMNLQAFLSEESYSWKDKDTKKKKKENLEAWQSDVFVRITKMKCLLSYVLLCDVLFQGSGDIPFSLEVLDSEYQPEELELAQDAADRMAKNIKLQLAIARADVEMKKAILSMCIYGTGILKNLIFKPYEKKYWKKWYVPGYEGDPRFMQYQQAREIINIPALGYVSVWDFIYDAEADEPENQRGCYERRLISPFELRQMKGQMGYYDEAIESVISGNAVSKAIDSSSLKPGLRNITERNRDIHYYDYFGRVPVNQLNTYNDEIKSKYGYGIQDVFGIDVDILESTEKSGHEVQVKVPMANDEVVGLMIIEGEPLPYSVCRFEQVLDYMMGIGPADNLRDVQTIMNGSARAFCDNKALAGNVIMGIIETLLSPGQNMKLYPGKTFKFREGTNVAQAMQSIVIPDIGDSLLSLMAQFERWGDDWTQLPKIMQGDVLDKRKPDTLGEVAILEANSGKYIGQVVRNIDDGFIEPIIQAYYDYNMLEEGNEELKGSYSVRPLGYASYQNKIIIVNALRQFLAVVSQSPELMAEVKLKTIIEKIGKSLNLDPKELLYSDEEKARMAEQQQAMVAEQAELQDKMADEDLGRKMALEGQKAKTTMAIEDMKAKTKMKADLSGKIIDAIASKGKEKEKGNGRAKKNASNNK